MGRGRYPEASSLAGRSASATPRHTPDRLCTSGLATMIVRSSKAKPFHITPRWTTAAAGATTRETRLGLTAHLERRPTAGPGMHGGEPAGVWAQQCRQLEFGPGARPG